MLFLSPVAALLMVLAGIIAFNIAVKAHATGVVTLYVGQSIGLNSGCSSPGFTSVQTAVDVANPGDVVYLCGTTPFAEQVIIEKAITLTGDPGASIQAPNPFPATPPSRLPPQFTTDNLFVPQAIVIVWGTSSNAKIKNLTIEGVMPGNGGCAEQEFGVLVIADGTATLNGDTVKDIRDSNTSLYGCQFGIGIQVGREYWPKSDFSAFVQENFVGHGTIKSTIVSGYQKNGITIDGPGTTGYVSGSTVNGAGRNNGNLLSPIIAQNGLQISRGASVQALSNTVTGNSYTGSGGASSGGILVYGGSCDGSTTPLTTNTKIQYNNLQDNDVGVLISNLILDGNSNCSLPITATSVLANKNHITNSAVSNTSGTNLFNFPGGYQAGISDEGYGDKLTSNAICGVGYAPVSPPPYVSMIDVAATNPVISGNTTCTITSGHSTNASVSTQKSKVGHIHSIAKPVK